MNERKEKSGCGCFTWILVAAIILFALCWMNAANVAKQASHINKNTDASESTTSPTVLPGSAAEAVQNGELTMADIKHRADSIGWSTDAWQEWYYIANKTGTTMEAIEEAAAELNKNLAAGEKEFVDALNAMGISLEDAREMKPEELFDKVISGLQATDG